MTQVVSILPRRASVYIC